MIEAVSQVVIGVFSGKGTEIALPDESRGVNCFQFNNFIYNVESGGNIQKEY